MNNLYVYRSEGTTVHRFVSWDQDLACFTADFPITFGHDENVLVRRLMEIPEVRQAYFATLLEAARYADEAIVAAAPPCPGRPGSLPRRRGRRLHATTCGGPAPTRPGAYGLLISARMPRSGGPGWLESEALRAQPGSHVRLPGRAQAGHQ